MISHLPALNVISGWIDMFVYVWVEEQKLGLVVELPVDAAAAAAGKH